MGSFFPREKTHGETFLTEEGDGVLDAGVVALGVVTVASSPILCVRSERRRTRTKGQPGLPRLMSPSRPQQQHGTERGTHS